MRRSERELPHVVIVGGGFGGLSCARALRRAAVRVTLVDRLNHHLFQPLLYQVATAALSPAQIAAPIRQVLSRQRNASVMMAEVTAVDTARRRVPLDDGELSYDWLVLAAGAGTSWFGNEHWAAAAPGLKTIEDALEIRERLLESFERAEKSNDPATRAAELTFVIVGGGPTGVEMAGAIREIALHQVPRDFRRVDTTSARIILVEAQDRLLPAGFDETLCRRAERDLREMGVEVRLETRVTGVDAAGVELQGGAASERIATRNVIWAAGIRPSPVAATLGAPLDRAGRVVVEPDLSVPGHPELFVVGDMARVANPAGAANAPGGREVPGIAPAAMQMGRHAARIIAGGRREPFRYRDKGMLATIGRARAVGSLGGLRVTGLLAWLLWSAVHVVYLISFRQRLLVMLDWIWSYVFFSGGARLITNPAPGRSQPPPVAPPQRPDEPDRSP
jgi:NADH dehydrogenase